MKENMIKDLLKFSESDEPFERLVFGNIVGWLAMGMSDEVLKDAPADICKELARIYDKYSHVQVGTMFERPKFEEYAITNELAQSSLLN